MIEEAVKQVKKKGFMAGSVEPIIRLVEVFFSRISTQVFLVSHPCVL
jgi:hypothetical protein